MNPMRGSDENRLDALFRSYRESIPEAEPGANFMPDLWRRIDARRNVTFSLGRMANAFVTAALAFSILLGVYMAMPRQNSAFYSQTYMEALDSDSAQDMDAFEPVAFVPDQSR
jgi:hypothetical protein